MAKKKKKKVTEISSSSDVDIQAWSRKLIAAVAGDIMDHPDVAGFTCTVAFNDGSEPFGWCEGDPHQNFHTLLALLGSFAGDEDG